MNVAKLAIKVVRAALYALCVGAVAYLLFHVGLATAGLCIALSGFANGAGAINDRGVT
jgi:hypothetical protein